MKQLNKLAYYLMIAVAAFAIGSCSKKGDDIPDKADPKMLSFGFYAEDNEDNLFRDYIVSSVTGNAIQVELPKDVDRTKLVARFTTTDNTTVTVSGIPQQSGVTKNDFSTPVDYIITEGKTNARYTVTIVNAADYVWTRVGAYTAEHTPAVMVMKVNSVTGVPHFLYRLSADEEADQKAYAVKYQDNTWSPLGGAISAGRAGSDLAMVFDKDEQLYVTYPDYITVSSPRGRPTVKRYNGSNWSVVGTEELFPAQVTYTAIGINPVDNQPILFNYIQTNNYSGFARRGMSVSYFNGSTWNIHNSITGRPETQVGGITRTKTVDDVLYVAIYNNNVGTPHDYSVYTYRQGTWTTIIDKAREENTLLSLRDFDMDVDHEGNIYIIVADAEDGGTSRPRVKKYTAATQTWSQIGNPIDYDHATGRYFSLAVSPGGTPHVLYRNGQEFPVVVSFDPETQDWGTPTVLESVKVKGTSNNMYLEFANDGTGYASYINDIEGATDNDIVLYKFDLPNN